MSLLPSVEPRPLYGVCDCRVKELEASAPVFDKPDGAVPVPAANDTLLRKQSSDLAVLRTTNVSDYAL